MKIGFGFKLLILMIFIAIISLSSSYIVVSLTNQDFLKYNEGQKLDQLYWIISDLEDGFMENNSWDLSELKEDMMWSTFLGFKFVLKDSDNKTVITTPNVQLPEFKATTTYPLFKNEEQIGTIFVQFEDNFRIKLFQNQILKYFLITTFIVGLITLILSYIFSRKLTKPLNILTKDVAKYAEGDYEPQNIIKSNDEIGDLSVAFYEMGGKLKKYEDLRKKILTNTAHELRTPLTIIRGNLEGIVDGIIKPDEKTMLSILEEIQRLQGIIESIEKLSKAESAYLNLEKTKFGLLEFFMEIKTQFKNKISTKSLNFQIDINNDVFLTADRNKMKQVFINIVSNAIRAMDDNGSLIISAKIKDDNIYISVKDTGKGIKSESLPYIFERFYSEAGGFGVGLAIVKEIVNAHNGDIRVISEEGKGSEFIIKLPSS